MKRRGKRQEEEEKKQKKQRSSVAELLEAAVGADAVHLLVVGRADATTAVPATTKMSLDDDHWNWKMVF
jgi:hypothetical protein